MPDVLLGSATIYAGTLVALVFLGHGLTRFLLPKQLQAEGLIWTPFIGYTFMSIVFHILNVQFLDGRRVTAILFALATIINVAAIVTRRPHGRTSWRLLATLMALTTAVYAITLVPMFAIGHLTAIGKNLDLIDIYDPTAAYVMGHPVNSMVAGNPPNPLVLTVTSGGVLSNGWGFSYLQAMASILLQRSPIQTQTPIVSLMHALMLPALFIFFRRTVGVRKPVALAIATAVAVHGLILSMLYMGLGNHIAMLAMMPLVLAATFTAISARRPRGMILAAFMVTNIPLTYWTAFAFFLPPVAIYAVIDRPLRLSAIAFRWPYPFTSVQRAVSRQVIGGEGWPEFLSPLPLIKLSRTVIKRCLALGAVMAGSVVLALVGYNRILNTAISAWNNRNSHGAVLSGGWGSSSFVNLSNLAGFSYWAFPVPKNVRQIFGPEIGNALLIAENVGLMLAIVVAGYALWCLPWRRKMIMGSLVIAYGLMLIYLRFISHYFYGYMKAQTFVAFVLLGLALMGVHYLWSSAASSRRGSRLRSRALSVGIGLLFASLLGLNGALTTAFFFKQPETALTGSILPESSLQLRQVAQLLPPGAPVFISETPPLRAEDVSALAYFLRHDPLFGKIHGVESYLNNPAPAGHVVRYGVLAASEDPADHGYQAKDLLWSNNYIKVYKRGSTIAYLPFRGKKSLAITPQAPLVLTADRTGI
ncbi:MAG: hypothetical protein ACYDAG_16955, partial [Chloroflexota bacterium]